MPAAAINATNDPLERLAGWEIPTAEQTILARDCMLYALSVGLGSDPIDRRQLRFVTEADTTLVPSMILSLAAPGFWFKHPALGLDWSKLLNVEQSFWIEKLPAPNAELRGQSSVVGIIDRGPKGALVSWRRDVSEVAASRPCASVLSTFLLRGDGSRERIVKGGDVEHETGPVPSRASDRTIDVPTSLNSGLLYRLNGTFNPLHADPDVAVAAGFPRPIMPGTASLGWACATLLAHVCDYQPTRLASFGVRLSAPIYPGDTLRHEIWIERDVISFRVSVPERGITVLDRGCARILAARP